MRRSHINNKVHKGEGIISIAHNAEKIKEAAPVSGALASTFKPIMSRNECLKSKTEQFTQRE